MNSLKIILETKTKSVVITGPGIEFSTDEMCELAAAMDQLDASEFGHKVTSETTHRDAHSCPAEYEACRECNPDYFGEFGTSPGATPDPSPALPRKNKAKGRTGDPPPAPKKAARHGKGPAAAETEDDEVTVVGETDDEEEIPSSQMPPRTPGGPGATPKTPGVHVRKPSFMRAVRPPATADDNANPAALPEVNGVP